MEHCECSDYRNKLAIAANLASPQDLASLGNGIEAIESVVTAIASFALTPESYLDTIANVIFLGGDTDTLAAMAGAISGAFLGIESIPKVLFQNLESSPKGRDYIVELADRLHGCYESQGFQQVNDT